MLTLHLLLLSVLKQTCQTFLISTCVNIPKSVSSYIYFSSPKCIIHSLLSEYMYLWRYGHKQLWHGCNDVHTMIWLNWIVYDLSWIVYDLSCIVCDLSWQVFNGTFLCLVMACNLIFYRIDKITMWLVNIGL